MTGVAKELIRQSDQAILGRVGVPADVYQTLYKENPPWEIGVPQPEILRLEGAGLIAGDVLDIGCASGEHALFLAARGYKVVGIDFVEPVLARARARAGEQGLRVEFLHADALRLTGLGRRFDTLIDSATFHGFSDEERLLYARVLHTIARPDARLHLICFADLETRAGGPRRIRISDIAAAFGTYWDLQTVRPVRYLTTVFPDGARAWAATLVPRPDAGEEP